MKPLTEMTKVEIERLDARRYKAVSANTRALINAGFGNMRGSEIRDRLSPASATTVRTTA